MVVYHIDRSCNLKEGQVIELDQEYFKSISRLKEPMGRYFPEGFSSHGKNMTSSISSFLIANLSNPVIEAYFEMVRLKCFSHLPSRYQIIFALDYIKDINDWPELIGSESSYKIFEIEVPSAAIHRFDSRLLFPGINKCNGLYEFLPHAVIENAYNYWSRKLSKNPRYEILLKLPVTIGKEISILPTKEN